VTGVAAAAGFMCEDTLALATFHDHTEELWLRALPTELGAANAQIGPSASTRSTTF